MKFSAKDCSILLNFVLFERNCEQGSMLHVAKLLRSLQRSKCWEKIHTNSIYGEKLLEPGELFFLALQKVKKNAIILRRINKRTSEFCVKQTAAELRRLLAQMAVKL
jgi:hypothetical protein